MYQVASYIDQFLELTRHLNICTLKIGLIKSFSWLQINQPSVNKLANSIKASKNNNINMLYKHHVRQSSSKLGEY